MDLTLSEYGKKLVSCFRSFGEEYFTPRNVNRWVRDQGIPDEVAKQFVDLYCSFEDDNFGARGTGDKSTLARVLIVEELSRCAGATLPFQNDLFNLHIAEYFAGNATLDSIMEEYRSTGRIMFALAVSEPGGGSDTMSISTHTKTVDGRLVLNGRKTYVNNGEYAPYILVAAVDKDETAPSKYPPLAFWLVPRNLEGIKAVPISKIGQGMLPFASLSFENVELRPEYRLEAENTGFPQLFKLFEHGRTFTCASSLGMAQAAMDDAVFHARSRKAFDTQIAQFQQIQELLTDMEVKLCNMRASVYRAALALDGGEDDKRLAVVLMKRYVPKASVEVASDAMQILGGLGYTEYSRVSRIWQDCRGNQIAEGTDQIMVRIAAPLILNKYAQN